MRRATLFIAETPASLPPLLQKAVSSSVFVAYVVLKSGMFFPVLFPLRPAHTHNVTACSPLPSPRTPYRRTLLRSRAQLSA